MKQIKFLLPFFIVNFLIAQHNTTGELEIINENGLYEIKLPNAVRSFSNRDLSDFRIVDSKGDEVPYFLRKKGRFLTARASETLNITLKTVKKDTSSSIVFKNPFKTINSVVLTIANYSGSKKFSLLGSNNQKEWFGVLNTGYLSGLQSKSKTYVDKTITFPSCNYAYLKIVFNDKKSLPINVLKIESVSNNRVNRDWQIVNPETKKTLELPDKKKTVIHVLFKNKEIIDRLEFKVITPKLFNRQVVIYKTSERIVKNKKESYKEQLAAFQLNSENKTAFNIHEIFEDDIFIEIENKDSNALNFSAITFFQEPLYAVVALKKQERYSIKTGDKTAKTPEYDLSFFRNNIPENLPEALIKNIVTLNQKSDSTKQESPWQKSWFMWSCIGVSGLVILFFILNLVKDLSKE